MSVLDDRGLWSLVERRATQSSDRVLVVDEHERAVSFREFRDLAERAAAGLYALDHMVDRLAEDHANARWLAEQLARLPGVKLDPDAVETNLVFAELPGRDPACSSCFRCSTCLSSSRGARFRARGF